jgi:predicted dehydrogenase
VEIMFHSIYYIDSLRYLLGDPAYVFTSGSRAPGETTQAETKTLTTWEYKSGLQVLIDVCHTTWQDDHYAVFRFEGTEGVIKGTIGLMYNYARTPWSSCQSAIRVFGSPLASTACGFRMRSWVRWRHSCVP